MRPTPPLISEWRCPVIRCRACYCCLTRLYRAVRVTKFDWSFVSIVDFFSERLTVQ